MKARLAIASLALLALAGCGTAASQPNPAKSAIKGDSSCDIAREALLTGSAQQQTIALRALKADKAAPATAREYAGYWLVRDLKKPDLRQMDADIISTYCS